MSRCERAPLEIPSMKPPTRPAPLNVILALLIFALAGTGCQRSPYDAKISATNAEELNAWISRNTHRLGVKEIAEINACLSEIRISFMLSNAAKGANQLAQKLCEAVDGEPLKNVLVMGYEAQIERLEIERSRQRSDLNYKEKLRVRPTDTDSERFLEEQRQMVREQIKKFDDKILQARARLKELRAQFGIPEFVEGDSAPQRI